LQPWREDGHVPVAKRRFELDAGEEVDKQTPFRAGEVADGKSPVRMVPGHFVTGPDIAGSGVDPQAEQAAWREALLRGADMRVRGGTVAMLKDLDADDQRVGSLCGQGAEVTVDEAIPALRGADGELGDGLSRDIKTGEIEPAGDQWQVVAAVAAAYIQAMGRPRLARSADDVTSEGHRLLAGVTAGRVLGIPGGGGITLAGHRYSARFCGSPGPGQDGQFRPLAPPSPRLCLVHGAGARAPGSAGR
jgi:hypothetical protein